MKTAIALWCIVAVGCKQSPVIQQSSGYATMTVSTSEKTLSNNYSASIRGKQDIDIYPQVSGFITKLCVAEGESVKKGQVLFIIDQVPYQAALNTAIANVEAAKASVATAQLTYESKQELYKNKVVSEFDLKTANGTGSQRAVSISAYAVGNDQWQQTEYHRKSGHQDRAQTNLCRAKSG